MAFQAEVFAWWAAHAVAGAAPGLGLSQAVRVVAVGCETGLPVDDVAAELSDGGYILVQAKGGLRRLDARTADVRQAVDQLVNAVVAGLPTREGSRLIDPASDRLVIATDLRGSRAFDELGTVCARLRNHPASMPPEDAAKTAVERRALKTFRGIVEASWVAATGALPTQDELRLFFRVVEVERFDFAEEAGVHRLRVRGLLQSVGSGGSFSGLAMTGLVAARERSWRGRQSLRVDLGGPAGSGLVGSGRADSEISFSWLNDRAREAVKNLGPRYNEELTVAVPVGRAMAGFARLEAGLVPFRRILRRTQASVDKIVPGWMVPGVHQELVDDVADWRREVESVLLSEPLPLSVWRERCDRVLTVVEELKVALDLGADGGSRRSEVVGEAWSEVWRALEWLDGDVASAWNSHILMIVGEAGRGKSHLLADTLMSGLDRSQPAVLLLGQAFLTAGEPWSQVRKLLDWPGTSDEFLAWLNALAKDEGRRALLMVDALNEGQGRLFWPAHVAGFLERVSRYDSIGVVLTVRSVALDACVPRSVQATMHIVEHDGFAGIEYDAVRAFFNHYGLIGPATPLLLPEFREPLFLALYCRTAQLRPSVLADASLGLTNVLARYLEAMDEPVRTRLDADPLDCAVHRACVELAKVMHTNRRRWLHRHEAKDACHLTLDTGGQHSQSLFAALLGERVLVEDVAVHLKSRELFPIVRFAYERLADHLVARILIDSTRQHGGYDREALARLVTGLEEGESTVDALALLIPEMTGLELTDVADGTSEQLRQNLAERVVQSLPLRDPAAITDRAAVLLEMALFGDDLDAARRAAEVAIALSCRPDHRLDHCWLHTALAAMPMYQRDMTWTAATAGTRFRPTPYSRVLRWVDIEDEEMIAQVKSTSLLAIAVTLMWARSSPIKNQTTGDYSGPQST